MRRMYSTAQLIKLIQEHGGEMTPEKLSNILKGSEYINVDVSESGTEVDVRIDEDLIVLIDSKQDYIDDENPIGASNVMYDDDHSVDQVIYDINTRLPEGPSGIGEEGTYVLKCVVDAEGIPTYSWELEER